jgi:hypothetical protein
VLPNGTWLSTGITRLEIWPADRRKEATQRDVLIGDRIAEHDIGVVPSLMYDAERWFLPMHPIA